MTRNRHGQPHYRKAVYCANCRTALAYIRPEWLFLRRLLVTDAAMAHERKDGAIHLRCSCGATTTVQWAMIQF